MCCGPCACWPIKSLRAEGHELRGFFFNPNIHPHAEFSRRLEAARDLAGLEDLPLIVRDDYPLEDWLRAVVWRESMRCEHCYHLRLDAAARLAAKSGFDAFTTTLLYSRQQKHDRIRRKAEAAGRQYGVRFLYRDFREGWRKGIEISKAAGLYRQDYCGCIYSERDRRLGAPRAG